MMRLLTLIFLVMAGYGLLTEYKGAGLLALLMAGVTVYGTRQLDKRDREYLASPASAKTIPDTLKELERQGAEGGRSEF